MKPADHYDEAQKCLDLIKEKAGDNDFGHDQANTLLWSAVAHSLQGILMGVAYRSEWCRFSRD